MPDTCPWRCRDQDLQPTNSALFPDTVVVDAAVSEDGLVMLADDGRIIFVVLCAVPPSS